MPSTPPRRRADPDAPAPSTPAKSPSGVRQPRKPSEGLLRVPALKASVNFGSAHSVTNASPTTSPRGWRLLVAHLNPYVALVGSATHWPTHPLTLCCHPPASYVTLVNVPSLHLHSQCPTVFLQPATPCPPDMP
eukprot:gene4099-4434_t